MRLALAITYRWAWAGALVAWATACAAQGLKLNAAPPDVAAKFSVTTSGAKAARDWYFFRSPQRIAVLKGDVDEVWQRDAQGRLSFERVFHHDQKAVDYNTGELATLGVQAEWSALATLVDAHELAALKLISRHGSGAAQTLRLQGFRDGQRLRVHWLPALQLPALVERQNKGRWTRLRLVQHAGKAPANWPQPGQRSSDYLRFDAADFGDMDYEPVVRKSEALDVLAGWRVQHKHD